MRAVTPLLVLALWACRSPAPTPSADTTATAPASAPPAGDNMISQETKACIERWIQKHGLNKYGDPADTLYAGGTPLFDESSGKRIDRFEYILSKHPELKDCKGDGP